MKLDATGNITWQKSLGGTNQDYGYSIQQTTGGGYIVAGYSNSNDGDVTGNNGGVDCWIVKLDTVGNITWQKSLGGSGFDSAYSIKQTQDGGFIVACESYSNDGDVTGNNGSYDYWIVKLDSGGEITWQKSFGGSEGDAASSIQQTNDGGYIIAGSSYSNDGDLTVNNGLNEHWIIKLLSDEISNLTELNSNQSKKLIKIVNLLGQEVEPTANKILIYQYSDGTSEKVFTIED